jgi:hypothetical protein
MTQKEVSERGLALKSRKLTTREAATYLYEVHGLPIAPRTLDNKAWAGAGPPYFKAATGRRLYAPDDLDSWAAEMIGQPRRSTSDAPRSPTTAE